jgi:hypothetical protein
MPDWIVNAIAYKSSVFGMLKYKYCAPGPFAAARASSPIKKSKSSVPLFIDRCPVGPAPPVRYEGLFATAGRPDPELVDPPAVLFVAMAVGKTKEGESLPAKPMCSLATVHLVVQHMRILPSFEKPVPLDLWLATFFVKNTRVERS